MQNIKEILSIGKWPPKNYPEAYIKGFSHWYSSENINRIDEVLKTLHKKSDIKLCLDIGFGNPIVLEREIKIFPQCSGLYITLDEALKHAISKSILTKGNCYPIPSDFKQLDLISAYAFLHVIPDIPEFYKEAYRVLKKGGTLYTDGDRNINIVKIIRRMKMMQYRIRRNNNQFEYWRDILNVKANFHQEGIDYKLLKNSLKQIGFSKVIITPWFSFNPDWDNNILFKLVKAMLTLFKVKILSTHIQIVAVK